MNIYTLQKLNKLIKSERLKNAALLVLHVLHRRYLSVYFDPVLACNLRCKSCYFSNDVERAKLKGVFREEDIPAIGRAVFSRTLRLQIGCGAEPTLFKYNDQLIKLAKQAGVKYVSITTNANLLTLEMVQTYLAAGLDEITISVHGVQKTTYENLMVNGVYDKFHQTLAHIAEVKKQYPNFKLRLNYTINHLNVEELKDFFEVYGIYDFDILQLRALRNIGGELKAVDLSPAFWAHLKAALALLEQQCKQRGILYLEPNDFVNAAEREIELEAPNIAYAYISPNSFIEPDFDWRNETFTQFARRTAYTSKLFRRLL